MDKRINKLRYILYASLAGNIIFLCFCGYVFRDKWIQKIVALRGNTTVVMFGDSHTAQGKWVELLHRTDVLNSGFGGLVTYHLLGLLQANVIDKHPQICFVEGGINDIAMGVSLERIEKNYITILETLHKNKIIPVVTLTFHEQDNPVSQTEVEKLNQFLVDYCRRNGIQWIDMRPILANTKGLRPEVARDSIHLNEKGYRLWARQIDKVLKTNKI